MNYFRFFVLFLGFVLTTKAVFAENASPSINIGTDLNPNAISQLKHVQVYSEYKFACEHICGFIESKENKPRYDCEGTALRHFPLDVRSGEPINVYRLFYDQGSHSCRSTKNTIRKKMSVSQPWNVCRPRCQNICKDTCKIKHASNASSLASCYSTCNSKKFNSIVYLPKVNKKFARRALTNETRERLLTLRDQQADVELCMHRDANGKWADAGENHEGNGALFRRNPDVADLCNNITQEKVFMGGDDLVFQAGSACLMGYKERCKDVKLSQDSDPSSSTFGAFYRSPQNVNRRITQPTFSRDQALGTLMYLAVSKDVDSAINWAHFLIQNKRKYQRNDVETLNLDVNNLFALHPAPLFNLCPVPSNKNNQIQEVDARCVAAYQFTSQIFYIYEYLDLIADSRLPKKFQKIISRARRAVPSPFDGVFDAGEAIVNVDAHQSDYATDLDDMSAMLAKYIGKKVGANVALARASKMDLRHPIRNWLAYGNTEFGAEMLLKICDLRPVPEAEPTRLPYEISNGTSPVPFGKRSWLWGGSWRTINTNLAKNHDLSSVTDCIAALDLYTKPRNGGHCASSQNQVGVFNDGLPICMARRASRLIKAHNCINDGGLIQGNWCLKNVRNIRYKARTLKGCTGQIVGEYLGRVICKERTARSISQTRCQSDGGDWNSHDDFCLFDEVNWYKARPKGRKCQNRGKFVSYLDGKPICIQDPIKISEVKCLNTNGSISADGNLCLFDEGTWIRGKRRNSNTCQTGYTFIRRISGKPVCKAALAQRFHQDQCANKNGSWTLDQRHCVVDEGVYYTAHRKGCKNYANFLGMVNNRPVCKPHIATKVSRKRCCEKGGRADQLADVCVVPKNADEFIGLNMNGWGCGTGWTQQGLDQNGVLLCRAAASRKIKSKNCDTTVDGRTDMCVKKRHACFISVRPIK